MNGCWNRSSLKDSLVVRDGWYGTGISIPRTIKMIEIPTFMTKTCQYQKLKKDDIKCVGCRELEEV